MRIVFAFKPSSFFKEIMEPNKVKIRSRKSDLVIMMFEKEEK